MAANLSETFPLFCHSYFSTGSYIHEVSPKRLQSSYCIQKLNPNDQRATTLKLVIDCYSGLPPAVVFLPSQGSFFVHLRGFCVLCCRRPAEKPELWGNLGHWAAEFNGWDPLMRRFYSSGLGTAHSSY